MSKFNKDKLKGFIVGIFSVVLFGSIVGTAFGAANGKLMNIKVVQGGLTLYVDGQLFVPKDAKGNTVEPIIYEGTTYLPLRAVATALGKDITYDSKTSSVYIGKAPGGKIVRLDSLTPYNSSFDTKVYVDKEATYRILDKTYTPFNIIKSGYNNGYLMYILDSKYRSLDAEFVVPYTYPGEDKDGKIQFLNVQKNGEETLIAEFQTKAAEDPLKISVDLRGVEILKIVNKTRDGVLYNITLTEID